jgi:hypothetical protein
MTGSGVYHATGFREIPSSVLSSDVRSALRSYRHDLAGRVHVLLASLDLFDESIDYVPADIVEATKHLKNINDAWHRELKRYDELLELEPLPGKVKSSILSNALERRVPDGVWICDDVALISSIKHANKVLGRTGFGEKRFEASVHDGNLFFTMSVGIASMELELQRPFEVFRGDLDAALAEAEARLAGVSIAGSLSQSAALFRFIIGSI